LHIARRCGAQLTDLLLCDGRAAGQSLGRQEKFKTAASGAPDTYWLWNTQYHHLLKVSKHARRNTEVALKIFD